MPETLEDKQEAIKCVCVWELSCAGEGTRLCVGCGGDHCVCFCGGEIACGLLGGCYECLGEEEEEVGDE